MGGIERNYRVQIVAGDIASVISQLSLAGIVLQDVEDVDLLTVNITIQSKCYNQTRKLVRKSGGSCKIINAEGKLWLAEVFWRRPLLLFGVLLFCLAAVILPNRIFFVVVHGNHQIATNHILMNAENLGIKFGALASDIRSEELKNQLLESIPQLQWVGITTKGCIAQINVKERSAAQIDKDDVHAVTSIVAACDGIITEQTVHEGNPIFQVGDAVKQGDVLVSGYMDCGIKLRLCRADAEIFALTTRQMQFLSPNKAVKRGDHLRSRTCYKLRIGKKVINFCNHSGIMDACCVKMYLEDYWTLPGGFHLPVSIIKISHSYYETEQTIAEDTASTWLPEFSRNYLQSQMVSGEIVREVLLWSNGEELDTLTGIYACHEMIGREKYEGITE